MPQYCNNGKDHQHISKGSMKLAHNLDDRQERAQLKNSADVSEEDIKQQQALQAEVLRRYPNLAKLLNK
jgi:hypothetical protein